MTARYAVFSDVHLDSGRRLPIDRLADQERILQEFVDVAREHQVDGAWFAGDMYHQPHPSERAREIFARFLGNFRAAGIPLTAITGNALHDIVNASEPAPLQTAAVHDAWLRLSRVPELIRTVGDVALVTLPSVPMHRRIAALDGGNRREIFTEAVDLLLEAARGLYAEVPTGWPSALLGHWACDWPGLPPQVHDHEPVFPLAALEEIGFDVILMGHIHIPQQVGSAISVGPPAHTSFGEEGLEHGCWIVTFDGPGQVSTEFVPLSDRRYVTIDVDLTRMQVLEETSRSYVENTDGSVTYSSSHTDALDETDRIAAELGDTSRLDEAVVKIRYRVTEEQNRRVDQAALRQLAFDAGAACVLFDPPEILRSARVRVEGFEQGLGEHDALTAWTGANEIPNETAERLHEILTLSREASANRDGGRVTPGAFDPVSLDATNVGLFPDLHVEFEDGAMVLLGANGAGKSTVLTCLELALFAKDGGELRDRLLRPLTDQMELTLVFALERVQHRVRRGYRRSGASGTATLDLERWDGSEWESITQEGAKATQARLEQMLGMSREVACASWLLAQGDAPAFLKAEPKNRKAMMGEILDPAGLYAADAAYANTEAKRVVDALTADRARVEQLDQVVAQAEGLGIDMEIAQNAKTLATAAVTQAEVALEVALAEETANAAAAEKVRAAAAERDTAKASVDHARSQAEHASTEAAKLPAAREKFAGLEALVAEIPALETKVEENRTAEALVKTLTAQRAAADTDARGLSDTYARLAQELDALNEQSIQVTTRQDHLRTAEDGVERCSECAQLLGAEARAAAIASLQEQRTELLRKSAAKHEERDLAKAMSDAATENARSIIVPPLDIEDVAPRLAEARNAVERLATGRLLIQGYEELAAQVDALHEQLRAAAAELDGKEKALAAATAGVKDTAALAENVRVSRASLATHRNALDKAAADVVRIEERLAQVAKAREQITETRARAEQAQANLDVLRLAERAFGRDGIPVLLVETVLGQIDADANRILRRLPKTQNGALGLRFETQKLQANGKLGEELYVVVERTSFEQDVRTLSGGELSRVSFAVRVALGMLLGRLRGAASRVLVLDELPFLDETGDEALVALVRELIEDRSFSKVVCVSHAPNVRDAFDLAVEFICEDDVSSVISAVRELEAVPA